MFRSNTKTRGRFGLNKRAAKRNSYKSSQKTTTKQVTTIATKGFSETEVQEFQESFALFDTEGTGSILVGNFRAVLESLQETDSQTSPNLDKLLNQLSTRNDEEAIGFDDYLELMESTSLQHALQADAADHNNFAHVFELFDADNKGYITVQDLERAAIELGEHEMTHAELEEMIERAHSKHEGKVTLEEFSKLMTLNLFQKLEETAYQDM